MADEQNSYEFGNRPDGIDDPPRHSKFGTVVDEVGVYQQGSRKNYWKVIQRIEGDSNTNIRVGYYAEVDGEWSWSSRSMMLTPSLLNGLYARAVTEGLLTRDV